MNNPWKIATLGLALTGVTALSTGVTTAYLMRPTTPASADALVAPAQASYVTAPRALTGQAMAPRVVARPAVATQPAVVQPAVVTRPTSVQTVAAPVADDCATGGQRAMKIAKTGLVGTLAGAALGGGYGAYKTKQECGTIFGSATPGFANTPAIQAGSSNAPQAAWNGAANGISVFNAR